MLSCMVCTCFKKLEKKPLLYKIQSFQFYYLSVAPEVKVELQNGSLLCNATGIPNKYTFSKWEHRTANGYFLRSIDSKGKSLLAININSDEPIYTKDGQYQCTVSNGVPDENNITVQNGNSDVNFPGKNSLMIFYCLL